MSISNGPRDVSTEPMITDNDDVLGSIKSMSDAIQLLEDNGVIVQTTTDLGTGFVVLDDKDKLVKVPFLILGMQFRQSKTYVDDEGKPAAFVVMHVITDHNDKWIVTDGSSGIKNQAMKYANHGRMAGIMVPQGLIRSDFPAEPETGRPAGTTYYLS